MHRSESVTVSRSPAAIAARTRALLIFILAALLSACAAGSGHLRPEPVVGERFVHAQPGADSHVSAELAFWQRFDDPLLSGLVEDALRANHDLRIALARWQQAGALARQARLQQWPSVTVEAGAQSQRNSADQAPGLGRSDRDNDSYTLGVGALWELDLFGRLRRQHEASRADANAAQADLAALQVAIVAELSGSYFELRGLQARLRVARDNAANQVESLRVVQARLDAGQGTEFDTARAQANLASTQARLPALRAAIDAHKHRLAVLTGRTPEALIDVLDVTAQVPVSDVEIDPGTPGELLRRRPDIAAAEQRLAAATARIGVASADLFPRFTLGGLLGSQAADVGALFDRDSETRLLALGLSWSFLDLGRVRARIAAADAAAGELLARYEQTVLQALEETETALSGYRHAREEREQLRTAARASIRATELAQLQFDGGLIGFLAFLDAQRSQLDAEDALAQSEAEAAQRLIAVYRALAGGWPGHLPDDISRSATQPSTHASSAISPGRHSPAL